MTIQQIKDEWKTQFQTFSIGHQDWAANEILKKLKNNEHNAVVRRVTFMTNKEIEAWLAN